MATTSPPGRSKYVEFDEFIDFQLQKTRVGIKTNDIVTALAGVGTLFLAYILIFVLFDHWVVDGGFSPVGRWVMLGGLLLACAAWIVWRVVIPSRRKVTGLFAARAIETTEPGLKHTLLNLVDLRRSGRAIPEDISRAMEKRAAVTLSKADVDAAVDRRPLMRLSYALLALVVLCSLYSLFSPKKISASVWRALFPSSATAVDTAIKIDKVAVEFQDRQQEADATLPARSKPDVIVDLSYTAAAPEQVMLYYSTADKKYLDVPVPMKPDAKEPKRYRVRLTGESNRGILQNTTYRIEAGDAKAGPFQITVVRPPIATVKQVRYVYPKYMEREPKTQDGGHIETWEGTAVTVTANTDQPVTDAWLVFTDTEDISKPAAKTRMTITGGTGLSVELKREISFREDGSYPRFYHIECVGKNGFKDPRPALYGVTIRRDLPPEIVLIDPQENERDVPANTRILPLLYKARDPDFKIRFVTLRAELTRAGNAAGMPEEFDEQLFDGHKREVQAAHDWKLDRMRLKAGDTVKFRLEARDNKPPTGNRTFTRWVTLRIVEPVDENKAKQQLQADRDRQKQLQQDQPNNREDQNPGQQPQDKKPEDNGKKPKQKDGKGKKQDRGQGGAKKKAGNQGEPMPGQEGDPQPGAKQPQQGEQPGQKKDANGQRKEGAGQQPPKDDEELIRQALREQQAQKDGQKKGKSDTPGKKENGKEPGNAKQDPQNGNDPGMGKNPKQKQAPDPQIDQPQKTGMKKQPGDVPMPKEQGSKTAGKKEGTSPKTDDTKKTDDSAGPGSGKKNTGGKGGKKKSQGGTPGMPSPKKESGMEDDPTGGNSKQPGATSRKKDKQAGGGKTQKKSDDSDGPRKTVKNDGSPAAKKKAKGDETGVAEPNNAKNADPTRSKNPDKIKRREGTDAVKKKSTRSGDPESPEKKQASKNPESTGSKTSKKDVPENTGDRKMQSKDNAGPKSKSTNDRKDPGNQEQKGTGRKKGQKKSDRGEGGMSTPSKQGAEGSKQKGAGNTAKRKGGRQDGNGKKTGNSGMKKGAGSSSSPKPKNGNKPGGMQDSNTPGQPGDPKTAPKGGNAGGTPGNSSEVGRKFPQGKTNGGAGNKVGRNAADSEPDGPDAEQKDLNYGRKASNLVINDMEDKAKRGNVDKDWLKKHGWTSREQALKELARIRKRVNGQAGDPQFDEFLKSIRDMKFQSDVTKRTGAGVRKKVLPGDRNTGTENVPPHLRNYYRAFRRSVNK